MVHQTTAAISALLLSVGGVASFSTPFPSAAVTNANGVRLAPSSHTARCPCATCVGQTVLFSTAEETEAPVAEDKPVRKPRGPRGKPLSEFEAGTEVSGKVRALTNYGAFVDIGAQTDGLLHISQLSVDFVSDVKDVLSQDQEVTVRILNINAEKNQIGLSLLTAEQAEQAKEAQSRPRRERPQRSNNRRDDSAVLAQLVEKGWNPEQFVEGTVVSMVDFGAFVRLDASQLNGEVTGEMDGLVHISALSAGRASSVAAVVSLDEKVQVRVKAIADRKVSLSMVTPEDEAAKIQASSDYVPQGAADWQDQLARIQSTMPEFKNTPLVVDLRK